MNILVVDDEPAVRHVIRRLLDREFEVTILEADDGVTALDRLLKEPVDLVLLDLSMKVMSGIETLEAIRRSDTYAHLPVVLMTALADEVYVRRAGELGIAGFIVKPFTPASLRERLAGIISELQTTRRAAPTARFLDIDPSHRALIVDQSREFRAMVSRQLSRLCTVEEAENEFVAMKRCLGGPVDLLLIGATSELSTAASLAQKVRETPSPRRVRLAAAVPPEEIAATQALGLFDAVVARSFVDETFDSSLSRALGQETLARLLFHPTSPCIAALWGIIERRLSRRLSAGVTLHETPQTAGGDARWCAAAVEIQGGPQAWELRLRFQYSLAIELCQAHDPDAGDRLTESQIGAAAGRLVEELAAEFRPLLLARGLTARCFPARVTTAAEAQTAARLKSTDCHRWLVTLKKQVVPIELAAITARPSSAQTRASASPATRALDHAH